MKEVLLLPLGDAFSGLSHQTLSAVPRYLRTLRSYIFLGPRKFFLRTEVAPDTFMAPWPFFLVNVSLGAALAAAVELSASNGVWDWDFYQGWFLLSLIQDLLLVPCAFIAAWLLLQRVSAETLLTAFAYASAWRLASLPAIAYIVLPLAHGHKSALLGFASLAILLAYAVYLILGMAAHNFIEGRARLSLGILTMLFVSMIEIGGIYTFGPSSEARDYLVESIYSRFTGDEPESKVPHCDDAVLNGHVIARGGDALVWFEWGDTPAMSQRTRPRRYLNDSQVYQPIVNLRANTKYYFRIALKSAHGVSYGKIDTFVTADCDKPVVDSEDSE